MDTFTVEDARQEKRIDQFLVTQMNDITRGEIIRMIKAGSITVSGRTVKPSYKLKIGEEVEIGEYIDENSVVLANKNLFVDLVDNNDDFAIINKERGMQIHPSHRERKNTLVNALLAKFPHISEVGDDPERPGIVHRLDKETTGLLVVAKKQEIFDDLKALFSERKIQKTYHTLVFGHFDEKEGVIDAPIARATSYTKQKVAFGKYKGDSKEAITEYEVIKEYKITDELTLSLVEARPKTGRTHQIRVHMAHTGHPILGDQRYYTKTERKMDIEIPEEYDVDSFYLHAKALKFTLNDEEYAYNMKYPDRFNALVQYLKAFEV